MSDPGTQQHTAPPGLFSACLTAVFSLLRGSLLLFSARPGTPLRVLCVVAIDTFYTTRIQKRLPFQNLKTIAALLDLGASVNTFFDTKGFNRKEYRATRALTREAGLELLVGGYLHRLRALEEGRPSPGGGPRHFEAVRAYREAVARLSLVLITSYAFDAETVEEGVDLLRGDDAFEVIFRIVMLCQIMDDVLDRKKDAAAGLPSFLTATASASEALGLTRQAEASYRDVRALSSGRSAFPFRAGLWAVSAATRCALGWARWRV